MAKGERKQKKSLASRIVGLINPIRDPSLLVAIILTVIEEGGSGATPVMWALVGALNWVAVKAVIWLLVNFAFSFVYLIRKGMWVARNPRLAWRLLDALGTEEIIIGGLRPDMFATEDGSLHQGNLGFMPAGGMAGAPYAAAALGDGYGDEAGYDGYQEYQTGEYGQSYDDRYERGPQQSQRMDEMQRMLTSYSKLISDWMAFTEEKWRAVSDSQLGWKPLRGRWNGWTEIYSDSFGANDEDEAMRAAQAMSAENMARRFDNAQTKGSAASAVACFLRDLDGLRQTMGIVEANPELDGPRMGGIGVQQPITQRNRSVKAPIIRNPMIVDADQ